VLCEGVRSYVMDADRAALPAGQTCAWQHHALRRICTCMSVNNANQPAPA